MQKNEIDIVIASVPFTETEVPVMAPAMLKSIAIKAGYSTLALDLNILTVNRLKNHKFHDQISNYFMDNILPGEECFDRVVEEIEFLANEIYKHQPKILCLSLLTYCSQVVTKWLCMEIRKLLPNTKIIIGGPGIVSELVTHETPFIDSLKQGNLIDHYVRGDGEDALFKYLTENKNTESFDSPDWDMIPDLNNLPFPDYHDYDWTQYGEPQLNILGSRGCVRECTFCDIHEHWKKFQYRNAENIFEEMLYQQKEYGISNFKFHDSLINGNRKQFDVLMKLLSDHNNRCPDGKIDWVSYFIALPKKTTPEEYWKMIADSGAKLLMVGIESFSQKVRYDMKKRFTDEDIDWMLEMCKKYKINVFLLDIVGYPTETAEDHELQKKWLLDHVKYINDPIVLLTFGSTMGILPNTYVYDNQESMGITWVDGKDRAFTGNNHRWQVKETGNTYKVRMERLKELQDLANKLGYGHRANLEPHKEMESALSGMIKESGRVYENPLYKNTPGAAV